LSSVEFILFRDLKRVGHTDLHGCTLKIPRAREMLVIPIYEYHELLVAH
jgi:hypothetical protein